MSEHEYEAVQSNAFVFPFVAVVIGLLLDEVNKTMKFLNIPDSVLQFVFALFAGVMVCTLLPAEMVETLDNSTWMDLEPDTVLTILLPPLIFESSFKINSHTFFAKLWFIVSLTMFLYMGTWMISCGFLVPLMYIINSSSISVVFIFISIIVATDPVAVVAMLEQYGAPHRLRILIEGESLLNDGLALTAYRILQKFIILESGTTDKQSLDMIFWDLITGLLLCIIVTPIMGMFLAWMAAWFVRKLKSSKTRQGFIIVAVYGSFLLFNVVKGSSALGLVFFGVTLNYYKEDIGPETSEEVLQLWSTLAYCTNNVIFIFSGYVVGREIFSDEVDPNRTFLNIERRDIFMLVEGVMIYLIPLFARVVAVYFFYCLYSLIYRNSKPLPKSDYVLLSYAGLRGALGLILALELDKIKELKNHQQTKMVLLLTCATTVACLVIQGMTFSAVAKKEGTTKRSRYLRESNQRLQKSIKQSLDYSLNKMRMEHTAYLHGSNWTAVADTVKNILKVHGEKMDEEAKSNEDLDEEDLWGEVTDDDDGMARQMRVNKKVEIEAKTGLYGILLAKVRESWLLGMVSGQTSHVIVSMLEHGIDEGSITARDMSEYLDRVDAHAFIQCASRISYSVHAWLRRNQWVDFVGGMAGNPTFHQAEKPDILMDRSFEKWWTFHTILILVFNVFLTFALFTEKDYKYTAPLCYILVFLSTTTELVYIIALMRERKKESAKHEVEQKLRGRYWILLQTREMFFSTMNWIFIFCGTLMMLLLQLSNSRQCNIEMTFSCNVFNYCALIASIMSVIYRLLRTLPLCVILAREHFLLRELSSERVRLAILIYLTYFMKSATFPKELFSESVYKIVRKEGREFAKIVDANLRKELKERSTELDLVSVIKTRQAIRMMSHQLKEKLHDLRMQGFAADDVEERWDGIVAEIRSAADKVLTIPQLDYDAWLERLTWFYGLNETNTKKLKNLLVSCLLSSKEQKFKKGDRIELEGKRIAFVRKGICKVTEGFSADLSHEFYVHQGDIMGPRNLMLLKMKKKRKKEQHWSLFLPRRQYMANTYVEICFLEEPALMKMLSIPDLYKVVARYVQIKRIVAEVKHLQPSSDLTIENFEEYIIQRKAEVISSEKMVIVKDKIIGIVGCWTALIAMRPMSRLTALHHISGPAEVVLAPVDNETEGFIFFLERKTGSFSSATTTISVESCYEKSNYSIMDGKNSKKLKNKAKNKANVNQS